FRIDAIRVLLGRAHISPLESKKKAFIIDGAEFLSAESANSLLKVLEESPKHALWLLISKSPERLIHTIRSRCRKVWFSPLPPSDIQTILLGREASWDREAVAQASNRCNGSLTGARMILESGALSLARLAETFLDARENSRPLQVSQEVVSDDKKLG